jgi:uncharacterized membrane protein
MDLGYFLKLFTTFISGAVEIWAGVPAGLALGLSPLAAGLATFVGCVVSALFVILVGQTLRDWLVAKLKKDTAEAKGREKALYRIWDRYGVVGLGLLAPLVTGVPLGAAIGIVLGAEPRRLFFWLTIGTLIWVTGITVAAVLGIEGIKALR